MHNAFVWTIGLLAAALPGSAQVTLTEFTIPNGGLVGITAGPDGNIWFTQNPGNKIGRITPAGVITEFQIPGIFVALRGITAGPDGNLWFTEAEGGKIGRITTSGVLTEFPSGGFPLGITAGPDGNLWFTSRSQIGRITTSGVFTEFPSGGFPQDITAGPDGNLWFTDALASTIRRITTSGNITNFPIPTGGFSTALGLTAGPDGNIWFTELGLAPKIGRITPTGAITEFPIPTSANGLGGITRGSDGNLWFTESRVAPKIGRITPAGVITEFPIPTTSSLGWIVFGPDGNLWITEATNKVGKLTLGPTTPSTCKTAPTSVTALQLERTIPLANVLTTLALNYPASMLGALVEGELEIRELLVYNTQLGVVTSTVFLVAPGSPLPSDIGVISAANTISITTITVSQLLTSCSPGPSLMFVGTVTGSVGNLYGASLVGASAAIALGYTTDTPPKVHDVSETIAGVATFYSSAASGTLTVPAAPSTGSGVGGTGPAIVVKFANGSIAVPNAVTQALFSPFFLDASASSSSGGTLTFAWSTTSNSPVAFVGTGVAGQILVQLPSAGDYAIQLKVTDASGASATFSLTLEYTGRPN